MSYELPLFPLSGIVMPGGLLSLRLFERRYLDMVSECFRDGSGFGVCLIQDGNEVGKPARPYPFGTCVSLVDFDQGQDGLLHVVARGEREIAIMEQQIQNDGLTLGKVEDRDVASADVAQDVQDDLARKLQMILEYLDDERPFVEQRFDDPDWVCYRLMELLPLTPEARYELIASETNNERVATLSALQISVQS